MPDQTIVARNRTRRTVLTLAAAAFVVLVPTACDYAVATTGSSGAGYGVTQGGGQSGNGGAAPVTEIETVPAGTVQTLDPPPSADESAPDVPGASAPGSGDPGSGAVVTGAPDDVDEPGAPDTGGIENSAAATSVPVTSAEVAGSAGAITTAPAPRPPPPAWRSSARTARAPSSSRTTGSRRPRGASRSRSVRSPPRRRARRC